jgi:hypothetical protein
MNSAKVASLHTLPLTSLLCAGLLSWSATAAAQDAAPASITDFRVPIHRAPDPGDPGIWTSGPDYKASFHDGFTFYPVLGTSYPRNLPLRWTTAAITAGGSSILSTTPLAHVASDWRYTYVHGDVREVYDVRPEGVEQSFVFPQRPVAAGDLVIRGRITTELHCAATAAAHQALLFRDEQGNPIVRYGEAFAIDALGRRCDVSTAFDGEHVTLTVSAAWLAQAQFPLTVDPLTTAVTLPNVIGQTVATCDVGQQGETTTRNVMFAYSRIVSASDRDVFAYLCDPDYSNRVLVMSQVSSTFVDDHVSVAYVAGADRWIVGYVRGGGILRTYFNGRTVFTLNGGITSDWTFPFFVLRGLDMGGTYSGSTGLYGICAYWVDPTDGRPSQAGFLRINAGAQVIEAGAGLGAPPFENWDREQPSVNQVAGNTLGNSDGWAIVYQERNVLSSTDDWDLLGVRTNMQATAPTTPVTLVSYITRHVTAPKVSGVSGYYTLTYQASVDMNTATGAALHGRRMVWPQGQASPSSITAANTIVSTAGTLLGSVSNHGLAVNHEISTTAVATYTIRRLVGLNQTVSAYAVRLTGGGAPIDTHTLFSTSDLSAISPAVTFALPGQNYQIVYGTNEASTPLYGRRYTYPADAIEALYGIGCGTLAIGGHRPYLGNPHYQVSGHSGPANMPATLLVGFTPSAVPLDAIGMPGCMLNVNTAFTLGGATNSTGLVVFPMPLPETLLTPYDLMFQIAYVSPGANALNLQATQGLRAQVR